MTRDMQKQKRGKVKRLQVSLLVDSETSKTLKKKLAEDETNFSRWLRSLIKDYTAA